MRMCKKRPRLKRISVGVNPLFYCRADELFLCRFHQAVNVGDIVIVLEKIG